MSKSVKYGRWEDEDVKMVLEAFQNSDIGLNAASH
jgi:ribosome recycling factor